MKTGLVIMVLMGLLPNLTEAATPSVSVAKLRCEYMENPLGIDAVRPRLSWIIESSERGQMQSAYQIIVASSQGSLKAAKTFWNTGKVKSGQTNQIEYAGKPLQSATQYYWRVKVWDKNGKASEWSKPAHFSMGLLDKSDWQARWIGDVKYDPKLPMPLLRKSFDLTKTVAHAEVSVCGLGQFELHVNGKKATDAVMEPGWTNYRKNCPYVTYDVTTFLKKGGNAIGVMLGNGMYNVVGGRYAKFTGSFGPPKMILQMKVGYSDGSSQLLLSDDTWKIAPGSIVFSCIYGGEDYDATKELKGWDCAGFDDSAWRKADVVDGPGGELAARCSPPIKVAKEYKAISFKQISANTRVYDLGQNMSGWPVIKVKGPAGSRIKITPNETWDGAGAIRPWLPVSFTYTLKGDGEETWRPRFTYYGFRYAQAELIPAENGEAPQLIDLSAEFVHTASPVAGSFECSNDTVNRIHKLINMAILSNYQSVLTDCPQREKLGWLEQAHLVCGGVVANYDSAAFYSKIVRDMAEAQTVDGFVPDIAPEYTVFGGGFRDSPEWGSAFVICPWQVYQTYGDRRLLERHYEGMKKYVLYLKSKAQENIVAYGLGDWYDVGPGGPGESQLTSRGLTATAIYYYDIEIMRKSAELLRKPEDARMWTDLAKQVKKSFNSKFFHAESQTYDTGSQTANAMALVTGLAEESARAGAINALLKNIESGQNRVTAGDVGFMFLVHALSDAHKDDVVWDMVTQDKGPGYVCQLNRGATSLTEAWDALPSSSQNHLMLGHAEEWFYSGLAGIRADAPGFKKFTIKPAVVGDLTWVKAHQDCPYGRIECTWNAGRGKFTMNVSVPVNTTATVYIQIGDAGNVTESGKPIEKAPGVKFLRMENLCGVFSLQPGKYAFSIN